MAEVYIVGYIVTRSARGSGCGSVLEYVMFILFHGDSTHTIQVLLSIFALLRFECDHTFGITGIPLSLGRFARASIIEGAPAKQTIIGKSRLSLFNMVSNGDYVLSRPKAT